MGELQQALDAAAPRRAPGPDGMPYEFYQRLGPQGKRYLLATFNRNWETGMVPGAWRRSKIIPLHKSGKDPALPKAYRPVALTATCAKLCERIIQRRLAFHLEEHRSHLPNRQAEYRRHRTTEEQVAALTGMVQETINKGWVGMAIFADHAGAFDAAWRDGMTYKMQKAGLPPRMVDWYDAFLKGRRAQVEWAGVASDEREFRSGVAQGTCSGPTLFNLLVNDLPGDLQFADDSVIYVSAPSLAECQIEAQKRMDKLRAW
eukprot:gene10663-gene1445